MIGLTKVSARERKFLKLYFQCGCNAKLAYTKFAPHVTPDSADVLGHRLLRAIKKKIAGRIYSLLPGWMTRGSRSRSTPSSKPKKPNSTRAKPLPMYPTMVLAFGLLSCLLTSSADGSQRSTSTTAAESRSAWSAQAKQSRILLPDVDLVINDAYFPVLDTKKTYIDLYGGRGSGKSHFVAKQYLPMLCATEPGHKVMAARKVAATIRLSTWEAVLAGLSNLGIYQLCEINKTERTIGFPTGSDMFFVGADDPEKLKSLEGVTESWLEEATEFSEADFLNIDAAIKAPGKKVILTHNPIPMQPEYPHWINSTFIDRPHDDALVIKTTYRDNRRFLPAKYCAQLERLKDTNPKLWEMWANGNYATLEGVIFDNWDIVEAVPTEGGIKDLGYGMDFGFTVDPSTLVKVWAFGLGSDRAEVWLREDIYETGLNNQVLAARMRELGVPRNAEIIADSSEPKSIDELRQAGFSVFAAAKGPDSVRSGISLMQSAKIHILRGSTNLVKEFSAYCWKKNASGKTLPEPVDSFNHGIDAVRYRLEPAKTINWGPA